MYREIAHREWVKRLHECVLGIRVEHKQTRPAYKRRAYDSHGSRDGHSGDQHMPKEEDLGTEGRNNTVTTL
jgi:hypothetical protein